MGKSVPIQIIVHAPTTQEGRQELARRAAEVHAAAVVRRIRKLDCPAGQKMELLRAVRNTYQSRDAGRPNV